MWGSGFATEEPDLRTGEGGRKRPPDEFVPTLGFGSPPGRIPHQRFEPPRVAGELDRELPAGGQRFEGLVGGIDQQPLIPFVGALVTWFLRRNQ